MEAASVDMETETEPIFRATKRRKAMRRRPDSRSASRSASPSASPSADNTVKRPAAARRPRPGIPSNSTSNTNTTAAVILADTPPEQPVSATDRAASRFAPQTGHLADAMDKHMIAFIDSHLSRSTPPATNPTTATSPTPAFTETHSLNTQTHSASSGKLEEINLPTLTKPSTTSRHPPLQTNPTKRTKRNRRTSADTNRDSLVEAVMREARLDAHLYNSNPLPLPSSSNPSSSLGNIGAGANTDADEKLAQQFTAEYLANAEAHSRAPAASSTSSTSGSSSKKAKGPLRPGDEILKGPKLGGSRAARAAMHRAVEAARKGG